MSERIICNDNGGELREEIVRCRDCKNMFDWAYDRMLCKMWADGGMDDDAENVLYPTVKPDGFCAWGEPREGAVNELDEDCREAIPRDELELIRMAEKYKEADGVDSRERLEAHVLERVKEGFITYAELIGWLNRQAAITRKECERPNWDYCETCEALAELTAERDDWKTKCETREFAYKQADAERKRYSEQIDELFAERDRLRDIIAHTPKTEAECEACQEAHDRLMFNAKVHQDELRDELKHKQLVIDRQRDSFLKMEREYRELQDVCGELERTVENLRGD